MPLGYHQRPRDGIDARPDAPLRCTTNTLVETRGLEPRTLALQRRRSAIELRPQTRIKTGGPRRWLSHLDSNQDHPVNGRGLCR